MRTPYVRGATCDQLRFEKAGIESQFLLFLPKRSHI